MNIISSQITPSTQVDPLLQFGPIWTMSGALNFFGDGWPNHRLYSLIPGFSWKGVTLVAKTTTLRKREGQMPLKQNLMPKEILPKSIYVDFRNKIALNAVSLSGPGLRELLRRNIWQMKTAPLMLSFMSVADSLEARQNEWREAVALILHELPYFHAPLAIQLNESCPNTGHDQLTRLKEIAERLDIASQLVREGVYIVVKLSVEVSPLDAKKIADHPNCHGLCISNTISFRKLPNLIDWDSLFGALPKDVNPLETDWNTYTGVGGSPLVRRGVPLAGGLSGKPLLNLVVEWVKESRKCANRTHINAGGGIFHPDHITLLHEAGADSFAIGTAGIIQPGSLKAIVRGAYNTRRRHHII